MISGQPFERDVRSEDPNESGHRRVRLRQGRTNTVEGKVYDDAALDQLT